MLSRIKTIELTPQQYARVAIAGLVALSVIVLTGAAVRLTGSGLGCPDWPKCHGGAVAPLETHAVIEYGNRVFSALVGLVATAAGLLAWRRRPFRRDLAILGALLPVGVAAQGVLGGLTVEHELAPGFVMAHYGLSMITLIAAVALAWRARHEPGDRPRSTDRGEVWATRALLPLGGLVVFLGTAATGAGPHAGAAGTGELVHRIDFHGSNTLDWLIHWHGRSATLLGPLLALRLVAAAPPRGAARAPAAAHRPVPAARGSGDRRLHPVRDQAPRGGRLDPRRTRDGDVAGRALGGRRGGAARAPIGARARLTGGGEDPGRQRPSFGLAIPVFLLGFSRVGSWMLSFDTATENFVLDAR